MIDSHAHLLPDFVKNIEESMQLDGESLIGIAEGPWDLIEKCGT